MNGDPKASPTSNMVGIEPPYDMALPKITPEIWEVYQDEEFIEDSPRWEWTQAAVDFACEIVRPAVRAEIERLKRGNEILRDELAKIDALHDSVQSERDRLRAALEEIANGGICGSHETHFECPQSEDVCAIARAALSGEPGSAVETTADSRLSDIIATAHGMLCLGGELCPAGKRVKDYLERTAQKAGR